MKYTAYNHGNQLTLCKESDRFMYASVPESCMSSFLNFWNNFYTKDRSNKKRLIKMKK